MNVSFTPCQALNATFKDIFHQLLNTLCFRNSHKISKGLRPQPRLGLPTLFCSPCLSLVSGPAVTGSSAFKQPESRSSGPETRFCCCGRFRSGSASSSAAAAAVTFSARELPSAPSSRQPGYGAFKGLREISPLCETTDVTNTPCTKTKSRDQSL